MVKMNKGVFVISLDFELMWGNIESWTVDGYGKTNVEHVHKVIPLLLELLQRWQVKVTFASVGLIMQDYNEVEIPRIKPSYNNSNLSPYEHLIHNIEEKDKKLYFAPGIIDTLKVSPYVEIGTHTYCHYYCREEGQTIEQFDADLEMACKVARQHGITLKSIVFPRNQVSEEYLEICRKYGLTSYRGNAKRYYDTPHSFLGRYKNRLLRILDSYVNIGGYTSYHINSSNSEMLNISASRFLRPYSHKLFFLEKLKLNRIKKEMMHAAQHNEIYHLWWHPHNFGRNIKQNFEMLEKILAYFNKLHKEYGMESMTMTDIYSVVNHC